MTALSKRAWVASAALAGRAYAPNRVTFCNPLDPAQTAARAFDQFRQMSIRNLKTTQDRGTSLPGDNVATAVTPAMPNFDVALASCNDQLLRQTRVHHVQLSMMADSKANMLLTSSSILVTLSAGHLADPNLRWPAMVLIAGCLLSVAFAALTTMPKFFRADRDGKAAPDTTAPNFNPLFFADFTRLSYGEYLEVMERTMSSPSTAYEAQLREIYLLGSFLGKSKYRWLRLGYVSFMAGLAGSIMMWLALSF